LKTENKEDQNTAQKKLKLKNNNYAQKKRSPEKRNTT